MFSSSSHPRSHRVLWKNRPFLVFQATFFQSSRLPFCAWLSRCWSTQGCTRMPLKQSLKMATNRHRVKYSPFNILRIQTLRQPDLLDFVAWAGTVNFDSHYVCGLLKQCARSFHVHVFIMDFFPQIAIAIGVLTSNRGEGDDPLWRIGRGTRVPLQGAVDVVPFLGAIVVCVVPLLGAIAIVVCYGGGRRVRAHFGGVDVVPLLGAIVVCYGWGVTTTLGELTWCHCWVPLPL